MGVAGAGARRGRRPALLPPALAAGGVDTALWLCEPVRCDCSVQALKGLVRWSWMDDDTKEKAAALPLGEERYWPG